MGLMMTFRPNLNFLPDGVAGGTASESPSENAEAVSKEGESNGASQSDVKPDLTPKEIPNADDKGVPYYNRYRELEEKYKGVDLDKWKKFSEIDPSVYDEEKEFIDLLTTDPELFNIVMQTVQGYKPKGKQGDGQPKSDIDSLKAELQEIKSWRDGYIKQEEEAVRKEVQQEYQTRYSKELDSVLKSKNLQELTEMESAWVSEEVKKEYVKDYEQNQKSGQFKLGWKEMGSIVKKYVDAVDGARRKSQSRGIKKDFSPDAMNGGGPAEFQQKPATNETKAQRVHRIASEFRTQMDKNPANV